LLGTRPSTVSREISRNGGYDRYRAALADEKAWVRARHVSESQEMRPAAPPSDEG
jgi:IS30 family transposase